MRGLLVVMLTGCGPNWAEQSVATDVTPGLYEGEGEVEVKGKWGPIALQKESCAATVRLSIDPERTPLVEVHIVEAPFIQLLDGPVICALKPRRGGKSRSMHLGHHPSQIHHLAVLHSFLLDEVQYRVLDGRLCNGDQGA